MNRLVILGAWLLAAAGVRGAPSSLLIPAGEAAVKTVGAAMAEPDSGWNLYSDGEVGDYVRVDRTGRYEMVVHASGSPARGVWPLMAVAVDRIPGAPVVVGQDRFADYSFTVVLSAGVHRVTAAFLNDEFNPPTEDRNLYIQRLEIRPLAGAAELVRASVADWAVVARQREADTLAATAAAIRQHRQGDATIRVVDGQGRAVRDAQVAVELVRHEFLFGCNFFMFERFKTRAENDLYRQQFAALFNYATLGFYWRGYEPQRGEPNYGYTDFAVAWCRERGIRLKGHPLLWNQESGVPVWSDRQPDAETQQQRVTEIMRRYRDRIEFWEVVNEPSHLPGLDIDDPYRWARAADPAAHLIVNDFGVMSGGAPQFHQLLREAQGRGVPFDGIGIQAHEPQNQQFAMDGVRQRLDWYGSLGKDLHLTEFTPTSAGEPITGSVVTGRWDEATQAEHAVKFYRTCFAHPAVVAITWWDLCDQGAWLKGGGMLRADLTPKPVYEALRKLIHEEWHTRAAGQSDRAGRFRFRGFHGRYRVSVTRGQQRWTGEFDLPRRLPSGRPPVWVVALPAGP